MESGTSRGNRRDDPIETIFEASHSYGLRWMSGATTMPRSMRIGAYLQDIDKPNPLEPTYYAVGI